MTPPMLSATRAKSEQGTYDTDFSMRWMQKELHLASVSAYEAGVAMPVVNVTKEIYRLAMRHGLADLDFSAVYRFLNEAESHPKDAPLPAASMSGQRGPERYSNDA